MFVQVCLLNNKTHEPPLRYTHENIPKRSFNEKLTKKEDIREIEVLRRGENAIEELNEELGLAFDAADLKYYTNLFKNVLKRNPTNVELFDLAQSNSKHSRQTLVLQGEDDRGWGGTRRVSDRRHPEAHQS
jgi:hypothetical protein